MTVLKGHFHENIFPIVSQKVMIFVTVADLITILHTGKQGAEKKIFMWVGNPSS
jgi:hypothetical protein